MNINKFCKIFVVLSLILILLTSCSKNKNETANPDQNVGSSEEIGYIDGSNDAESDVNNTTAPNAPANSGDGTVQNNEQNVTVEAPSSNVNLTPSGGTDSSNQGNNGDMDVGNTNANTPSNNQTNQSNNNQSEGSEGNNTPTAPSGNGTVTQPEIPGSNGSKPDSGKEEGKGEASTPSNPAPDTSLTYAEYIAMTPDQQEAYYQSYSTFEAFSAWYLAAKKEYDANKDSNTIVDGSIDIGEIMGKK